MRLTLRDIARMADVSQTTASRVLNGRGDVRPAVRARVEQVIADTGYRPLASAQSLASQRTGIIGLIVPLGAGTLFADPYFGVLINSLSRAAAERSLTMALFLFDEDSEQDTLIDQVVGPRRVDGLIVSAFHTSDSLIERLASFDVPVVTMGPNPFPDRFGSLAVDNLRGGELAGEHLIALDLGPLAMIGGPEDTPSGLERNIGFRKALQQRGKPLDPGLAREGDYTERSGRELMAELLEQRPRAVFVASDTMAAGALTSIKNAGLRVPDDIAVIGFDDLPSSQNHDLSTVSQPIGELGTAALDMLIYQISTPEAIDHRVLPVHIIERGSTRMKTP